MTELETITTLLGEFAATEIDGVKDINYTTEKDSELSAFIIVTENGKRYAVEIKEV